MQYGLFAIVQLVQQRAVQRGFSQVQAGVAVFFALQPLTLENTAFHDFGMQAFEQLRQHCISVPRRDEALEEVQIPFDEHAVAQRFMKTATEAYSFSGAMGSSGI